MHYATTCTAAVGNPRTIGALIASTSRRGRIFMFAIGSYDTPADAAIKWILQRFTTAGTATSVTPKPLDPGEVAAQLSGAENYSSEPGYTSAEELFQVGLNQRAPFAYHCRPGAEFIIPQTSANGIGMKAQNASATPNVELTLHHQE